MHEHQTMKMLNFVYDDDMTLCFQLQLLGIFYFEQQKSTGIEHAEWRCIHKVIHSHENFEQKGSVRDKSQKKGTIKFHESIQLPEQNKGY
jgi:hypothetical protein